MRARFPERGVRARFLERGVRARFPERGVRARFPERGVRARFPERGLVAAIHVGIALVLLTPLVWSAQTMFPFAVGKAVYSRTAIAALLVVWAVLAAWRPAYRPPRSALLLLLGAGLLAGALSAALGVGPARSVWSDYVRMEGLAGQVHWVAFAVVAASTVRGADAGGGS